MTTETTDTEALKEQLKPLLLGEEDDVQDLVDYTVAMVTNGKTPQYIVDELNSMDMDFCPPAVAQQVGDAIEAFLSPQQQPHEDATATPTDHHKIVSLKQSSGGTNALTMSGALGASRERNKMEPKSKEERKRDVRGEAFDRLKKKNDRRTDDRRADDRREDRREDRRDTRGSDRERRGGGGRGDSNTMMRGGGGRGDGRGGGRPTGRGGDRGGRGGRGGARGGRGDYDDNRRRSRDYPDGPQGDNKRQRVHRDDYHDEHYEGGYDEGYDGGYGYNDGYGHQGDGYGYNDGYGYRGGRGYPPRGRGRFPGRGGRFAGRGRGRFQHEGTEAEHPESGEGDAHPSPIVQANYGRGGGRSFRGGRGGGRFSRVQNMLAAKTWVRKKDDDAEAPAEEAS